MYLANITEALIIEVEFTISLPDLTLDSSTTLSIEFSMKVV